VIPNLRRQAITDASQYLMTNAMVFLREIRVNHSPIISKESPGRQQWHDFMEFVELKKG
jgi:hypothetical protein